MSLRDIENYRLVDGIKIDNLPADTNAALDSKLDDVTAGTGIFIDKTNPNDPIITNTGAQPTLTKTITFVVTADFASGEIIDITTGAGSISGTSDLTTGDTGAVDGLGVDAGAFNVDASLSIADNKTISLKGVEAIWDSATTFHFTRALTIGEWFIISDGETSGGLGSITVSGIINTGTSDLQGNVDVGGTLDVVGISTLNTTNITDLTVSGDTNVDDLIITGDITKSGSSVGEVITYVDDTAGDSIINLPTAVGLLNQSFTYVRTDNSANTTTLNPSGAETINNVSSFTLGAREAVTLISNNSNWKISRGNINGLFEIIINSVDDFPVQDATTITLNTGNYNIRTILVTDKQFILPDGAIVEFLGWDPSISGLVYTGVLSAFKGTDFTTFTHDHVFISTPLGTIFDVDNVSPVAAQIFMEDTVYIDCTGIGTVKNIAQFSGYFNAFVDIGQGFNLESVRLVNYSQITLNSWKNEVSTMFTFDGNIDSIQLNAVEYIPNTNESIFDFKVSLNIVSSNITSNIYNKTLGGALFAAGSRNETDIFLNFDANSGMPKSIANIEMELKGNATSTTFSGVNIPAKVAGTWTDAVKRFTFDASGRATYIGLQDVDITSISNPTSLLTAGTNKDVSYYYSKGNDTLNLISGVADQGGGIIRFTTTNTHGLTTGDRTPITNTTSYNDTYTITVIDANNFDITETFVATETGNWQIILERSSASTQIASTSKSSQLTILSNISLVTDDFVELFVENNSDGTAVLTTNANTLINE